MKRPVFSFFLVAACGFFVAETGISQSASDAAQTPEQLGSYYTGTNQSLFKDLLGMTDPQATARAEALSEAAEDFVVRPACRSQVSLHSYFVTGKSGN